MPKQKLSAELEIGAGLSAGFQRVFNQIDSRVDKTLRGLKGFSEEIKGMPTGNKIVAGLGRGFEKLTSIFRGTNAEIGRTHDRIGALRKQGRIYENLADHARKMGKAVQPWLEKVDRVNRELDRQERKLNQLRIARERLNKASRSFTAVKESVSPVARRLGYAGIGAAAAGGYALARGAQDYSNFDKALRVLQAEGVDAQEIPLIREQIFKFAETTQFTDIEIAEVLVGMKKDGQDVTASLTGVADIMRLAVAESRSLPEAWDATRTLINTTKTDLADALRLQEQMSNATSVSALNMEQLSYIAGQSLSIYRGIDALQSADFLALAGSLGGILRPERIATGLREFALTMTEAAAGTLAKPRQEAFDLLGLNITDEQGRLRDAVSILKEFERAFNTAQFKDAEGKIIGDKVQPILGEIFGREALPTIANLLGKSEQIAANIEKINTPGTLERKAGVMEQSLDAAANRLKSAVSVATKRFFLAMEGDGNFVRMLDTMSAGVQRFSGFITEHKDAIAAGTESFIAGLGKVAGKGIEIGQKLFTYFRERGPAIQQFFKDFWADLKGVFHTLKPVVMGVLSGFRMLIDTAGQLGAGNTKLLAWLTAAFIGWQLLKTPVMAANAAFNLVLGSIAKVRAAWTGLKGLQGLDAVGDVIPTRGKTPKPKVQRWGAPLAAEVLPTAPKKGPWGTKPKPPPMAPWQKFTALLTRFGTRFLSFFAPIGTVLTGIGSKLGFLMPVVGALGKAFAAVGGLIAGISAPVWAIVAAVAVGVALIIANWDKVKIAVGETWNTIKLFGSAVWETLKFVGGGIANIFSTVFSYADAVLKKFGIDITGIFTGLGNFFNTLFTGIWNGIKGIGAFLSEQFGNLMDWIANLNNTFQKFIRGWRDFFKEKNEARDTPTGLKVALPEPITPVTQPMETLGLEPIHKDIQTPEMPNLDIETPALPNLDVQMSEMPGMNTGGRTFERDTASIEYVNFAGVDEIDKTLKSGFESLLHINTGILESVRSPEAGLDIQTPEVPINTPTPSVDVPPVDIPSPASVNVPPITRRNETTDNTREGDTVEITNNFNIYQQPGESVEDLTAQIMAELERQGRTRYYE